VEYNIQFFKTPEAAFKYQNEHGGTLYVANPEDELSEYSIAAYLAEIEDEEELAKLGRFVVVDEFVRSIIERPCLKIID
jgi:hypothetical protein